ncbi:hypothetical protein BKA70DRAFT_1233754 [Coprinopsis sp. MPI-PUGE-AT-0042]|nr:hypothetical protein BKA70DRAFT_1233754 [Coprinopsis sp. MPI-PUGE-AT-0042]
MSSPNPSGHPVSENPYQGISEDLLEDLGHISTIPNNGPPPSVAPQTLQSSSRSQSRTRALPTPTPPLGYSLHQDAPPTSLATMSTSFQGTPVESTPPYTDVLQAENRPVSTPPPYASNDNLNTLYVSHSQHSTPQETMSGLNEPPVLTDIFARVGAGGRGQCSRLVPMRRTPSIAPAALQAQTDANAPESQPDFNETVPVIGTSIRADVWLGTSPRQFYLLTNISHPPGLCYVAFSDLTWFVAGVAGFEVATERRTSGFGSPMLPAIGSSLLISIIPVLMQGS